ncbi:MAG: methyltransferase domain-containing protein [Chloroflexota bacterium]|nr:MAG: methyltransferase domain-containing protein [Chloroflexota bacterium]
MTDANARALWPSPDRRQRWLTLMRLLNPRPGDRVLDVGAGECQALRYVAARVGPTGSAIGVEYGEGGLGRLAIGRAAGGPVFRAVAADASNLPFRDASFTAAFSVDVLEAVPDRERPLREMRRVVRPDGRVVVAHDDYESQVYTSDDRDLGRRAVKAYADATFAGYGASDGQMGRHLWGLFRAAGFRDAKLHVLPLVNTEYREPLFGWRHTQFDAQLVANVSDLTDADLQRWRADLAGRAERGDYVYVANMFVCVGRA